MTLHEFTGELLTNDARPPIIIDMMKTTKKVIAGIAIVAAFAVGAIAGQVNVTTYAAQNAGVAVAGFGHCAGFEYRGNVGAFVDVDCAS